MKSIVCFISILTALAPATPSAGQKHAVPPSASGHIGVVAEVADPVGLLSPLAESDISDGAWKLRLPSSTAAHLRFTDGKYGCLREYTVLPGFTLNALLSDDLNDVDTVTIIPLGL